MFGQDSQEAGRHWSYLSQQFQFTSDMAKRSRLPVMLDFSNNNNKPARPPGSPLVAFFLTLNNARMSDQKQ